MRRQIMKRCLGTVFFLTLSLLMVRAPLAATFTVNSPNDAGTGTLRQAITDANNNAGPDVIDFMPGLASPITLAGSLPDITETVDIMGPGSDNLRVEGNGLSNFSILTLTDGETTISGLSIGGADIGTALRVIGNSSLFLVDSVISDNRASSAEAAGIFVNTAGIVIINNSEISGNAQVASASCGGMNIQNGIVNITNGSLVTGNTATTALGGGICISNGVLLIDGDSQVTLNIARQGGGIAVRQTAALKINGALLEGNQATDIFGGAISNENSEATIEIENTVFNDNFGDSGGGAIAHILSNSTLSIRRSIFTRNTGTLEGGALLIHGADAQIDIDQSTFGGLLPEEGNEAEEGGAIFNSTGTVNITASTFANNRSTGADSGGGAILNRGLGTLTVANSTFFENSAAQQGGAIFNTSLGQATVSAATFSGNEAGAGGAHLDNDNSSLEIQNSLLAGTGGGNGCDQGGTLGGLSSLGNNLDSGSSCGFTASGDLSNTDPLLDPAGLQDNGGPTKTIALQNTSPAVDQGNPAVFEPTDQRGVTRPQGSAPDMGAFELEQASPTPPPSGSGGCRMGQIEQEPLHSLGNLAVFFFLLALGIFRRLQRLS